MLIAKVLAKGQIVIPKEVRKKARISPGEKVEVRVTDEGIVILPLRKSLTDSCRGLVKGKLSMKELERLYAEKS